MKVQCGQCPAKYAVSDERVRDKKVRIHCKRCGASIVVDGKVDPPLVTSTPARPSVRAAPVASASVASATSLPPVEQVPDSRPPPRPVAHTIMGGLEAPSAEAQRLRFPSPSPPRATPAPPDSARAGMPGEHRGFTDPPAGTDEGRWRVALTKQDLRWMSTEEIVTAYRTGAVKLETFIFRMGMPTWVTLLEVPEIAEALSEAGERHVTSAAAPQREPGARAAASPSESVGADAEGEPLPFALVAERANGAPSSHERANGAPSSNERASGGEHLVPPPHAGDGQALAAQVAAGAADGPPAADAQAAPEAIAPTFTAGQRGSGSVRWVWLAVGLVLVIAALAAFVGPRLGLSLR